MSLRNFRHLSIVILLGGMPLCWQMPAWAKPSASQASGGRVHVIGIGDSGESEDDAFGQKLAEDARNFVQLFETAFRAAGKSSMLQTQVIVGSDVTPRGIVRVVEALDVDSRDAIAILISSHGGIDTSGRHYFALREGRLYRQDLLSALARRGVRLVVLLSDCCSNFDDRSKDGTPVVQQRQSQPVPAQEVMDWRIVNDLFLRHGGVVDVTAAEPGFSSRVNSTGPGSLFTDALVETLHTPADRLLKALDRDGDGALQWDELLPQLRGRAADLWRSQAANRPQQAYAYRLGRWLEN
jgi:hypothetical protein